MQSRSLRNQLECPLCSGGGPSLSRGDLTLTAIKQSLTSDMKAADFRAPASEGRAMFV